MIIAIILQVILGIFFMITGTRIISGKMAKEFSRIGLPSFFNFVTGFFEIIGSIGMIIGIWYPIVALLSGLLLGATMLAAAFSLLVMARDPFTKAIPAIILCLLSFGIALYHFNL
ncbi:DoxX family protein [Paenibacillus sp. CGMCC 1.16610]|uniref:DoxX family membrane protein n=1 Tax=Paenibacillus anseongense TaxID=2682845 RepID=A0ABW9ULM1_9BACL|nr:MULTISPECIES: DoxX family protein [Paenibacillus]MBA2941087.1 DoxX family protein [Paenibacillus sp. CGMCC 1.16610]MVQ39906.1 DoxX family membrane protein [Paenibacillus anseongense]